MLSQEDFINKLFNNKLSDFVNFMENEYQELLKSSKSIRANLYRVNDAISMENQRLTSTSTAITNLQEYSKLPKMSINSKGNN